VIDIDHWARAPLARRTARGRSYHSRGALR